MKIFAFLLLLSATGADGKVLLHVSVDYEMLRTASFTIEDWEDNPRLWCLYIHSDSLVGRASVHFVLSAERWGEVVRGRSPTFTLEVGTTVKCNRDFSTKYWEEFAKALRAFRTERV